MAMTVAAYGGKTILSPKPATQMICLVDPLMNGDMSGDLAEFGALQRYDRLLWTGGLGRKLREQVQAAFSATPSMKRTPSIS